MRGSRSGTSTPLRATLLGVAAAAVLTACGGSSGTTSASGSSTSSPPPTSTSSSSASSPASSPASSSASGGAASGSDFCTQARSFVTEASQAVAAGATSPDASTQLQALAGKLQAITPPPEIASDWQSAVSSLQQLAQAYQGVNLQDPQQLVQLQQKVTPVVTQLTTSGQKIDQYLQSRCGISIGGTSGSAAPSS